MMIYLADDYIEKYSNVLSYLIGRTIRDKYTTSFIERIISYSACFSEFEKSNVTIIAFSSSVDIYNDLFPQFKDNEYTSDPFDEFAWAGQSYIKLFMDLRITFESLFLILPIEEMLSLYKIYHEMAYSQLLDYVKSKVKYSYLDLWMKRRKFSTRRLATETGISLGTINALRYAKRDISKLEVHKALLIANKLNIKIESLLPNIELVFQK